MRKSLLLLLGLLLILILSYFCFTGKSQFIKTDLVNKIEKVYEEESIEGVTVTLQGNAFAQTRRVVLQGEVETVLIKENAQSVAESIKGVSSIENQLTVLGKEKNIALLAIVNNEPESVAKLEKRPSLLENSSIPYVLSVKKLKDKQLILHGYVPSSKVHEGLIAQAKRLYGAEYVVDELQELENAPIAWEHSAKLGLEKLALIEYGNFEIKNHLFSFEGYVESQKQKNNLLKSLDKNLAINFRAKYKIETVAKVNQDARVNQVVAELVSSLDKPKNEVSKSVIVSETALSCEESFKKLLSIEKIHFASNKSIIKEESFPLLDKLIKVAQGCFSEKIIIEGHTDSDGSTAYNQRLSEQRARSVKKYFVKHGIETKRLKASGYGELKPISDNNTEIGRTQNRRIEFHVKGVK